MKERRNEWSLMHLVDVFEEHLVHDGNHLDGDFADVVIEVLGRVGEV